jgi:catechol 2,3-dioxygenase-like lactoylglutathione lyase family enzyme
MLEHKDALATVPVKDLRTARKFYEGTLGLKPAEGSEEGAVAYLTGGTPLLVYESKYAGTNQATAVTWIVGGDLETSMRALKDKGVRFEHYDLPQTERKGDVHVSGRIKNAWFKDPDGNIHALVSM